MMTPEDKKYLKIHNDGETCKIECDDIEATAKLKNILVREVSMRLPFATWLELDGITACRINNIEIVRHFNDTDFPQELDAWVDFFGYGDKINISNFKLLLRPTSDLTPTERKELEGLKTVRERHLFYLSHHIDDGGLIQMGLAKPVTYTYYFL